MMTRTAAAAATALLATTSLAAAGGIERSAFTTGILFEEGTFAELSFGYADPSVSGTAPAALGGASSGDVTSGFLNYGVSYRTDLSEALSLAFVIDRPVGANVDYPAGTGYPFAGSSAEITSNQLTAMLRYELSNGFSAYGGVRAVMVSGSAYVSAGPAFAYQLDSESDIGFGYMGGVAYELPQFAARVALTYFSEVSLDFTGTENPAPAGTPEGGFPLAATSFNVTLPQSVLLEAQTGVAPGTLVFGSVRWTDWGSFDITPARYPAGSLVDYPEDVWTYTLGVGRQLTDSLAVSATVDYETEQDGTQGNLGPTDGRISLGLGAEYTINNISIGIGGQYILIGDAATILNRTPRITSTFADNTAWGVGVRIGIQF